jgi:hypothetical protein
VAHGLKLVILAGFVLLGPKARNRLGAGSDIQLESFAINLHLSPFLLKRLHPGNSGGQLSFEVLPLQRYRPYFVLKLPDFLLSILNNEQLFQVCVHGPEVIGSA